MKPFSLKEYLKDPSKEVITRDGRAAKIYCTNYSSSNFPIVAQIEDRNFSEIFTIDGHYSRDKQESRNDLFFAQQKKQGWVNIYRDLKINELYCRYIFPSEEEAKRNATSDTITTVKIEWEE